MKVIFSETTVTLSDSTAINIALLSGLRKEGFTFCNSKFISTQRVFCDSLEYPLYTNKREAKKIYRSIQKTLELI